MKQLEIPGMEYYHEKTVFLPYDQSKDDFNQVAEQYYKLYPDAIGKVTLILYPHSMKLKGLPMCGRGR